MGLLSCKNALLSYRNKTSKSPFVVPTILSCTKSADKLDSVVINRCEFPHSQWNMIAAEKSGTRQRLISFYDPR